jgi:uncharacterized protein (TIGR04255 family)
MVRDAENEEYPHLPRAPITEALIDYRVQPREGITPAAFSDIPRMFAASFPLVGQVGTIEARLGFDDGGRPLPAIQQHQQLGTMLRNTEKAEVVQFRIDGFTYNKLAPYTSWEEIYPRAAAFWREYVAIAEPVQLVRVAVRFINKIRLPLPISDLAEYLRTLPTIPPELPQQIRHFLTRVVLYEPTDDVSAIVTQALEPSLRQDHIVLLFDTDAFREMTVPVDSATLDQTFQALRRLKNRIFFKGLTPKALELFR